MGRLYVVSTPIGNLEDVSARAVRILGEVARVLAEDTRRTRILLSRHGVRTSVLSAHVGNEEARARQVVGWLDAGEELALVTDAGTPLLSDPGARIVRATIGAGHEVVPIPGASALLAALVGSGLDATRFTFLGFPPRSGGERTRRLEEVAASPHTVVLYEAANRLPRLLADLAAACGPERNAVVARELTKAHEEFARGTLEQLIAYYPEAPRGEVVVLVESAPDGPGAAEEAGEETARVLARALLEAGRRPSAVARELARELGIARNRAYEIALAAAGGEAEGGS